LELAALQQVSSGEAPKLSGARSLLALQQAPELSGARNLLALQQAPELSEARSLLQQALKLAL
jgi:hypothetical protein